MTQSHTPAVEALPKVAFVTAADVRDFGSGPGESTFLFAPKAAWNIALTPHAPAQAQIDALRIENERLRRELEKTTFALGGWKEMMWAVARELNCLPSTFWDGNAHVLKAAINLNAELAALKAEKDHGHE